MSRASFKVEVGFLGAGGTALAFHAVGSGWPKITLSRTKVKHLRRLRLVWRLLTLLRKISRWPGKIHPHMSPSEARRRRSAGRDWDRFGEI